MKILFCGDAACSSGFARCTHAACDELHRAGWDVHVLGINYYGDKHKHPYTIYPCFQPLDKGRDLFGVTRLPRLVERIEPDVVVLLNDPWNIQAYMEALEESNIPVVGWLAVDAKNQRGEPLNHLAHVVTWTQFALDELRAGGYEGEGSIVPLGVDTDLFYPRDRAEARRKACPPDFPEDAFVVGVVGRNQPRKRLDLTLAYFADWAKGVDDAWLYLHVAPTGDRGFDIRSLVRYYGLQGRVILAEPHIGVGVDDGLLPWVYSSFDVYLTTTQGEGFGLPALESMACGVPCVVPDFSGLGDWPGDAALKIPCTSSAISAPLNSLAYTVGGVPDRQATVWALSSLYNDKTLQESYRQRGLALAADLTWQRTGEAFREALESVLSSPVEQAVKRSA